MRRIRFSEEQIVGVLKEAEAGTKVGDLCRRYGVSGATFYTWRSKYAGLDISEIRRLRRLDHENRRLKTVVAHQALDIMSLKEALANDGCAGSVSSMNGVHESPERTVAQEYTEHPSASATFGLDGDESAHPGTAEMPNGAGREGLGLFVLEPAARTYRHRARTKRASGVRQRRRRSRYKRWLRNNALTIIVVLGLLSLAWHIAKP